MSIWSRFLKNSGGSGEAAPPSATTAVAPPAPVAGPSPAGTAPLSSGTTIVPYRPELVNKLKDDHRDLLDIYTRLSKAAQRGHTDSIASDLIAFRRGFQSHILVENVSFYVYLERILANSPEELGYVRSLRKDMNGIARVVADFIHTWTTQPPTVETLGQFESELSGIGKALAARIELEEESLYVLYVPA